MRDPARINKLLELIKQYWHEHPDLRIGQVLFSLTYPCTTDIFYVEDDMFIKTLEKKLEENDEKLSNMQRHLG